MAEVDIAPELYEQIRLIFNRKMSAARAGNHKTLFKAVETGKPTYKQADEYSRIVGSYMSQALQQTLTIDALPNGKLYYNIAERTLGQALVDGYEIVADGAVRAQRAVNEAAEIGIKPIRPAFATNRAEGLVDLISAADIITDEAWVLGDPVVNFHQHIVDESIEQNAKFHEEAGLEVTVTRTYDGIGLHDKGEPCPWCLARVGTYHSYEAALSAGAFQRHVGCRCPIDYTSKKGETTRNVSRTSGWF